jgi:hypothetical protein
LPHPRGPNFLVEVRVQKFSEACLPDLEETKTQLAQLRSLVLKLTKRLNYTSDYLGKAVEDVAEDVKALRTELEEWSL